MDLFGLNRLASEDNSCVEAAKMPSLWQSLVIGGTGFCLASLLVFATVAFAERWMYQNLGLGGAYATWTILFIFLGGAAFLPLLIIRARRLQFYLLFGVAFLFYAVGWIGAYFILRGKLGEWVAAFASSVLMALVFAVGFGVVRILPKLIAVLFVANSAGYFLGDVLNNTVGGRPGMLLWGAAYGLFLGAGLGAVLYFAQAPIRERLRAGSATPV